MKIFSVYDVKAEAYQRPIFALSKGLAIRAFDDECNEQKSQLYHHPEDFTLFEIGEFDEKKGRLTDYEKKVPLGTALEFKKQLSMVEK